MSSRRDYVRSVVTDAMLPVTRQLLQDVVMEVLTDRQVPTRTDYKELRDVVNGMRGQASGAASGVKKLRKQVDALTEALEASQAQLAQAEADRADLIARVEQLESK